AAGDNARCLLRAADQSAIPARSKVTSMKRALAFLVLGPALAAATTLVVMAQAAGPAHDVAKIFATAVFFFTLPVSAITACVDGVLNDVPVPLRAGLSAT